MKKIILHIVLLSYTLVMLKPAMPYVKDFIDHVFFYTQHMATVHYENGKYHVHKELVNNAKKNESQKELPSSKKENNSGDHIVSFKKDNGLINALQTLYQISLSAPLHDNYLAAQYHPPKA